MWSLSQADANSAYTRNTVKVPTLANGIAIYGGTDITVSDNLVTDTMTQGAGIQIANVHPSHITMPHERPGA